MSLDTRRYHCYGQRDCPIEAFSDIVQRHAGLVYGACLRVLSDHDKAADATQETFLELLRNAEKITGSLSSCLHRVATRREINMVVKDSSRRRTGVRYYQNRFRAARKVFAANRAESPKKSKEKA